MERFDHLLELAKRQPFCVPKIEMLELLQAAGFGEDTLFWREICNSDDPALVSPDAILLLVEWAKMPE